MNARKSRIAGAISSIILTVGIMPVAVASPAINNNAEKPNVVVLYLDDSGFSDISANGGIFPTPHLDKLSKQGINLSNFYTSSPVSSPSRSGLLTGRLSARTGMYGKKLGVFFEMDKDGLPQSEVTIADMLKENGYDTMYYGKWHLGIGKDNKYIPTRHGFDNWYGIPTSNDMWVTIPKYDDWELLKLMYEGHKDLAMQMYDQRTKNIVVKNDGKGVQSAFAVPVYKSSNKNGKFHDEIVGTMQQAQFTQNITQRAVSYIKGHKKNPFFMFVSYPQTHVPLFTSKKFNHVTKTAYGDVITEIDSSAGQILDTLHKQGLDKNTIVLFTSDNGPWLPFSKFGSAGRALPYRGGKGTTWEGGVRVPTIISWPGHIIPRRSNQMISALDILPTLADLTHSKKPNVKLDGYNMARMLLKGDDSPRKVMPYYFMGKLQAFRSGNWKIRFIGSDYTGKTVFLKEPELYNLKDDIGEKFNVARFHPEIIKELTQQSKIYNKNLGEWKSPAFDLDDQIKEIMKH